MSAIYLREGITFLFHHVKSDVSDQPDISSRQLQWGRYGVLR